MVCVCVCVSCVCSVGCVPWSTSAYLHLDEALGRCCVCSVCVCVRGVVEWCTWGGVRLSLTYAMVLLKRKIFHSTDN